MASIVLSSVGSAVGNAVIPGFGSYFGGALGSAAGGLVDQKLGISANITGPRLDNLSVQDSRYGAGIPIIYGTARIAGNVIWSSDLIQATHTSNVSGGKGGISGSVSATTYSYSVHCAVGIAAGPIGSITTIWADSTVIYQNGVWTSGIVDAATIYTGDASQAPDPFMESILGSGAVPAYRGLAYVIFENLQLANFGNRLPNLTFEVSPGLVTNNPTWLGSVDAALSQRQFTMQSGGMMPLILSGSTGEARTVLLGGYIDSGSSSVFETVTYDVTGNVPVELNRVSSASFTTSTISDSSWSLCPDKRFVALYLQSSAAITNQFVLYDTATDQFGTVLGVAIPILSPQKKIEWLDAQHFVIEDTTGGVRGLHVFARAGLDIIDLGFWNVWGTGTAIHPFRWRFVALHDRCRGTLFHYDLCAAVELAEQRLGHWRSLCCCIRPDTNQFRQRPRKFDPDGQRRMDSLFQHQRDLSTAVIYTNANFGNDNASMADHHTVLQQYDTVSDVFRRPFGDVAGLEWR